MKPYELREKIEKMTTEEKHEILKQNNIPINENSIINLINVHNCLWHLVTLKK